MPIYLAGSVQRVGGNWDCMAVKLRADGSFDTDFSACGVRYVPFNQPG